VVLWFRPQGVIPERKARFFELPLGRKPPALAPKEDANVAAG
jgi:hypothetical protein